MIKAEIIADSINSSKSRLTTYILEYPRFLHSEMLTHRMFSKNAASCLDGDTLITIEKPSALKKGKRMNHSPMTIREIVNKWFDGDSVGRDMKTRLKDLNLRCLNEKTEEFISAKLVNCIRSGVKHIYEIELENGYILRCTKEHRIFGENGWFTLNDIDLTKQSFGFTWRNDAPSIATNGISLSVEQVMAEKKLGLNMTEIAAKYDLKYRTLATFCEKQRIFFRRKSCPNETIQFKDKQWLEARISEGLFAHQMAKLCHTTVDKVKKSISKNGLMGIKWNWGMKETWNKGLTYSLPDSSLINVRLHAESRRKKESYKKYDDNKVQITRFLTEIKSEILQKYNYKCALTGLGEKLELHHIDPVWHNSSLALDKTNIIPICKKLHRAIHYKNLDLDFLSWFKSGNPLSEFWPTHQILQKTVTQIGKPKSPGNTLLVKYSKIKSIKYIGEKETFDLEVAGPYHNFVANGVVVHNSRAIPIEKMIQQVIDNPAMPIRWGKNQSGMQAKEELDDTKKTEYWDTYGGGLAGEYNEYKTPRQFCIDTWLKARDSAIEHVKALSKAGLHKQITNRILEPWFNIRVILSATEFENFFALRAHPDAQPEIQALAYMMLDAYNKSEPKKLQVGEFHIPFGDNIDNQKLYGLGFTRIPDSTLSALDQAKIKISIARCARISYFNYEGKDDYAADIALCDRLFDSIPRHLSPTEHVAQATDNNNFIGNFRGFKQFRYTFEDQNLTDPRVKIK